MVGVELETLDNIRHQFGHSSTEQAAEASAQNMSGFCQKMLSNFYNYVSSFVENVSTYNGPEKAIPAKVVDQWYKNFENKMAKNPNFWKE